MTTQILISTTFPQKKLNKFSSTNLQKGAEVVTAILMVVTFVVWFFVLSA